MAMKDYVRFRMTGDYVTNGIEAMGFLLLDAKQNKWSPLLCSLAGIDPDILPPIVDPMTSLSPLCRQAQADTGLTDATLVIAGATGYLHGGLCGRGNPSRPGHGETGYRRPHMPHYGPCIVRPRLVTYRHVINGLWYPGTATKSCAASNRWFRDTFGGDFNTLSAEAASVPRGCEGLFFHPYLQGEITPYLDDKLRASFVGASGAHTRAHFNRAVLEGVAYSMKDCYETLRELNAAPSEAVAIGGGIKSALWRQILADMLGIPLATVENVDSSLGSAMLAGVAAAFSRHKDAVAPLRGV